MDPKRVSTSPLGSTGSGSVPSTVAGFGSTPPVGVGVANPVGPTTTATGPAGPSPFVSDVSEEPTAPEPVTPDPIMTAAPEPTLGPTIDPVSVPDMGVDAPPAVMTQEPAESLVEEPIIPKPVSPIGVSEEPVAEEPAAPVSPLGGATRGPTKMSS